MQPCSKDSTLSSVIRECHRCHDSLENIHSSLQALPFHRVLFTHSELQQGVRLQGATHTCQQELLAPAVPCTQDAYTAAMQQQHRQAPAATYRRYIALTNLNDGVNGGLVAPRWPEVHAIFGTTHLVLKPTNQKGGVGTNFLHIWYFICVKYAVHPINVLLGAGLAGRSLP